MSLPLAEVTDALFSRSWVENLESWVTIIGILVAGVWTYFLFIRGRAMSPRMEVVNDPSIVTRQEGTLVLRNVVTLKNIGSTEVVVMRGQTWVQVTEPVPRCEEGTLAIERRDNRAEIDWPIADEFEADDLGFELEPGESEHWTIDFLIPDSAKTVLVYSCIRNEKKWASGQREIVWSAHTTHKIQ